jgi:hypothetical protein
MNVAANYRCAAPVIRARQRAKARDAKLLRIVAGFRLRFRSRRNRRHAARYSSDMKGYR